MNKLTLTRLGLVAAVLLLGTLGVDLAAASTDIVVKPSALDGWFFHDDGYPGGTSSFVAGPGTAPSGSGSLRMTLNSTARMVAAHVGYAGTRLDQLTNLQYSTYRSSIDSGNNLAITLQFDIDYDLTDANTTWQGRLVFEPYMTPGFGGTVVQNTWQTWEPLLGKWWASGAPGNATCPQSSPCTFATVLASYPNAGLRAGVGAVSLKAGGPWAGFDGNVDKLRIGVNGTDTTYDFEPETQCTATCYVNAVTGNNSFGGDTPASAKKTIQAAVNQVSPGGSVIVAPGTYNENVVINKNGLTLEGAGAGTDPSIHTIIDGSSAPASGAQPGITLANGITGTTIKNLRVQNFASNSGIYGALGNSNLTVDSVHVYSNNTTMAVNGGGIYMNGPVSNVTINNVDARFNKARGIVIWNGFKQNITFTNNTAKNNGCCGIELQDGTASGVTVTGNLSEDNGDSGMAFVGLKAGAGPNLIASNTVRNNGRFGIEIKLPDGTGLETGDGSIVVKDNTVERTIPIAGTELRDLAGIAVFRRGYLASEGNVDIPTGVVVKGNTVSGYHQPSTSDGFGIVVEGTNMTVIENSVSDNDVGIQIQQGHTPYVPNGGPAFDGNQSNLADEYFGRGNSPVASGTINYNNISGNTIGARNVGVTPDVDATCNWWNASNGPSGAGAGSGDAVTAGLLFAPWLMAPWPVGECGNINFEGFFQPIDNSGINVAKAGQVIPVKWRLTDNNGDPIDDPASFSKLRSYEVACTDFEGPKDAIEEYAAGSSGLQYLGDGYWQFNWKTPKSYATKCRAMYVEFGDGSESPVVNFKFK